MFTQSIVQQRKLKEILLRSDVWLGGSYRFARKQSVKTGYSSLDDALIQSGWPLSGLIEISQSVLGQGEWQLLSGAIGVLSRQAGRQAGYITLVGPPENLYLPGLKEVGLNHEKFLVIEPKSHSDFIYSFVVAAGSQACTGILCWESASLSYRDLRKLQLSAIYGSGLYVLFRNLRKLPNNSPANLKIEIKAIRDGIEVFIHKQRGSFKQQRITISYPEDWRTLQSLSSPAWLYETDPQPPQTLPISS